MNPVVTPGEAVGLLQPAVDAHTLGAQAFARILGRVGIRCVQAPPEVAEACQRARDPAAARTVAAWARGAGIVALGFSYRLDPHEGFRLFRELAEALGRAGVLSAAGGRLRALLFAGLPAACELVARELPWVAAIFKGDESPAEVLTLLGLDPALLGPEEGASSRYEAELADFGRETVAAGDYRRVEPVDDAGCRLRGLRGDSVEERIRFRTARNLPPLMRAHVGPFLPDRKEAVALFLSWAAELARGGLLDVLSIGTSQLSQAEFGRSWEGLEDGGGVPIATAAEFAAVWRAARPMLVRSYAGTRDVAGMARVLEDAIDNAWHALSLWWFSELDGRGPNGVRENLGQHMAALRFIAAAGKPFEPNVPHHFAFRGADDLSCVVAGYLAARAAKGAGVKAVILQAMIDTPREESAIAGLAKARALLHLARELEDGDFRVYLQARAGLDSLPREPEAAKAKLAAATAMMDDIEPADAASPQIIHVVSYSEGYALADPTVVEESVRITRGALARYRGLRAAGLAADMGADGELLAAISALIRDARVLIGAFEAAVEAPYSAAGLYEALASGFLLAPTISYAREEFAAATATPTALVGGAIRAVDAGGRPIPVAERARIAAERARERRLAGRGR